MIRSNASMCQAFSRGAPPHGRYGIRGLWSKHQNALGALHVTLIFPTPIWSIDSILASASPAFSRLCRGRLQVAEIGPPRNSSSFVIMAHSMRAILFARAIAASILGLRARMRPSQEVSAGGRTLAPEITAIAPMIIKRRISRCPDLLVRPSLGLPPLECCRGTRPSQAEKSRARRKVSIGGAKAARAIEVMGPIPGIFCKRREPRAFAGRRNLRVEVRDTPGQIAPFPRSFSAAAGHTPPKRRSRRPKRSRICARWSGVKSGHSVGVNSYSA